jgi:hypothetical protein
MDGEPGASVGAAVIAFNVISSLASLAMAGLGWIVTMIARMPAPEQQDPRVMAYGVGLIVAFLTIPLVCVATSIKLSRADRRVSVLVSLAPAALVAAASAYFAWAGTYVPIR